MKVEVDRFPLFSDSPEPHKGRAQQMLAKYPQMRKLYGPEPRTFFAVFGWVAIQVIAAFALRNSPLWVILLTAYTLGAVANHALWVLIHECTHNLVFKKSSSNQLLQIFANLPIIFPSAISFRIYHVKHHLHMGNPDLDADMPRAFEVKAIGNNSFLKILWFNFFFLSQLIRVPFLKGISAFNRWVVLNWIVEISFLGGLVALFGWKSLVYLAFCSVFSVGFHPVGARWIQEHYVFRADQETYSYYGPMNKLAFNVGYHNEHHDFMTVSWNRLPEIRKTAPEFYDTLLWHSSWTGLLANFIFNPKLRLDSRIFRGPAVRPLNSAQPTAARVAETV